MRYGIFLCALAIGGAGCHFGQSAEKISVAQYPVGATAKIALAQGTVTGELLSVEGSGLILLRGQTLLVVPYSAIREILFSEVGTHYYLDQQPPDAESLRGMRQLSHFPQGIPVSALPKLRSMYAMDTIPR